MAVELTIKDFEYKTSPVAPGATVSVKNEDETSHTVTSRQSGMFDVVATASSSTTFTAPMIPGEYPFYCKYHGNMAGVLVVR